MIVGGRNSVVRQVRKSAARLGVINPFRDLFKEIEFETLAYCNRKCNYCPNVDYERFGEMENFFMKEEIFLTLIDQLVELEFQGELAPHLYGEPMADPRLAHWVAHVRTKLPQSRVKIVTNGDFLNQKSYKELINSGVDYFVVSKHGKSFKRGFSQLYDSLEEKERKRHFVVRDFFGDYEKDQEMMNNRGGDVSLENPTKKKPPVNCVYATYPVINVFGDLVLCCQDYKNNYVFGNIMDTHLRDLWYDPSNIELRKRVFRSQFDLEICQNCLM
jgi:2-deoxy-scyllo-inosamine dehydrogenase (SAM-dependent)